MSQTVKRRAVLIIVACLLIGQVSCRRKTATDTNSSASATGGASVGDRAEARIHLDRGKELYRNDEDSQAVEAFQQALKLDPDLAEARFRLGLAYEALGKDQEAEEEYKKAVEAYKKDLANEENSKDGEARYNLGQTYAGLNRHGDAVREYREAARLKPDDADIYYDLGVSLTRLAQYDEAAAAFSKSLEIDPENYRAQDALDEAREGIKRIRAGKKHQEDLAKKKKAEELKKQEESGATPAPTPSKPKKP